MTTDKFTLYDAAYVMGALSPTDRREFEEHLKTCATCATAVGELAGLPGLMSKVSIEDLFAEAEGPPDTLLPALARVVRRERGRRRLFLGASGIAAACAIAVGAVAISGRESPVTPPRGPSATATSGVGSQAFTAVVPSPVTARAALVGVTWGTRIELTCAYDVQDRYPAGGLPYALVVIDRSGVAQQVATWKALPGREITLMGASSTPRADVAAVEIRTLKGLPILRLST